MAGIRAISGPAAGPRSPRPSTFCYEGTKSNMSLTPACMSIFAMFNTR
jgi:hypothetical protein